MYDSTNSRTISDTSKLKKGNTIFVRYGLQHSFLDLSEDLRVDDSSFVYAVPFSLSAILNAHRAVTPRICKECGNPCDQRCAGCKQTFYCSRVCQANNWQDHKAKCRVLDLVAPVLDLDHTELVTRVPFR
ncbi:Zinc finger MYND domain-containing protein 10 [Podila humilis]|nr:Zinc finger MYND domain-containing protein 10 [Podila humilis]